MKPASQNSIKIRFSFALAAVLATILAAGCGLGPDPFAGKLRYDDLIGTSWWGHSAGNAQVYCFSFYPDSAVLEVIQYSATDQSLPGRGTVFQKGQVIYSFERVGKVLEKDIPFHDCDGSRYYVFYASWKRFFDGVPEFDNIASYEYWSLVGLEKYPDSSGDEFLKLGYCEYEFPEQTQYYWEWAPRYDRIEPYVELIAGY
jgi:hypothetical protein